MPTVMEEKVAEMDVALRGFLDRHRGKTDELGARMLQVEQALVSRAPGASHVGPSVKSKPPASFFTPAPGATTLDLVSLVRSIGTRLLTQGRNLRALPHNGERCTKSSGIRSRDRLQFLTGFR